MKVDQYLDVIARSRPLAWASLQQDIQDDDFDTTSDNLLFGPFDEVMQACFFLPWAVLLEKDVRSAIAAREAYLSFEESVERFKDTARAAAKLQVEAGDVQAELDTVSQRLDALLRTVPQ